MKRALVLFPVVGAFSIVTWLGCGGSTSTEFSGSGTGGNSDDGGTGGGSSTGGGAGAGGTVVGDGGGVGGSTGTGGGAPFDPGGIGGIIGGTDGGIPASDGGIFGGPINPVVVDGCRSLCAKEATANCPNEGTLNDCILGCRLILNNPNCVNAATTLFACEKTSTVTCDAKGKASLTSCGAEELSAAACFLTNASDPTLKPICTSYCAGVAAAKCPNDDLAGCATGCPVVGNFVPACNQYWKGYVTCASTAMFTCGNDGKAGAPSCALEAAQYALCTLGGALNTRDAGR
jgi:hypothetical protein